MMGVTSGIDAGGAWDTGNGMGMTFGARGGTVEVCGIWGGIGGVGGIAVLFG